MERVLGITLVNLNQKLSSGVPLSDREQECLGSFEPGLGQSLLEIQCIDAPYRISEFPIVIDRARFIDSDSCRENIANGTFSSCRLQEANLAIQTVFEVPQQTDDEQEIILSVSS